MAQATIQRYIDTAISSTVNLPKSTKLEEVEELYLTAWKLGLKGVTIYKIGCKREGIIVTDEAQQQTYDIKFDSVKPVSRKEFGTTHGSTYCKKCACGTLYITLNRDNDGNLVESFIQTSKGGICQANIGAVNRLVSTGLRSGIKVEEIIDQLKGIHCPACARNKDLDGLSCPDILSRTIKEAYNEKKNEQEQISDIYTGEPCPNCGKRTLVKQGGCQECVECGWNGCGD